MTETKHAAAVEWIKPMRGYVCILPIFEETSDEIIEGGIALNVRKRESGIILPDVADQEPIEGIVVAIGEGTGEPISEQLAAALAASALRVLSVNLRPELFAQNTIHLAGAFQQVAAELPVKFDVKIGDKVLWQPWDATTIALGGLEYNLVPEGSILGLLEDNHAPVHIQ
jgi:co-chaperonin GroES (HSP10)